MFGFLRKPKTQAAIVTPDVRLSTVGFEDAKSPDYSIARSEISNFTPLVSDSFGNSVNGGSSDNW